MFLCKYSQYLSLLYRNGGNWVEANETNILQMKPGQACTKCLYIGMLRYFRFFLKNVFLFLSSVFTTEKFPEYKHFCFYWVYIFKMAVCLALNKQATKTLFWAILATDVCVMYVFVRVSNPVQTDWISVSGKEI